MLFKKDDDRKISKLPIFSWTSNASGIATLDISDYKGYEIIAVQTVPGANGDKVTNPPISNYDVTLLDIYDFDWFFSKGLSRSISEAEVFCRLGKIPFHDSAVLTILNAGANKQGIVNLWVA